MLAGLESRNMIYNELHQESKRFYDKEGYLHLRSSNLDFKNKVNNLKDYYDSVSPGESDMAFRSADGSPRQFVNIFRDQKSGAYDLYKTDLVSELINSFFDGKAIFTHAKVSFKTPLKEADWYFHQDNGYKNELDLRSGFAIFICLEDMNEENGCLKIVPKSHTLGTIKHTRKVEHAKTGDNQLILTELPKDLSVLPILAKQGDIVIFHSNTIHGSGSSTVQSKRLSLISEVEPYFGPKLDDYGMIPIFAKGKLPQTHRFRLFLKQFINPLAIWFLIKKRSPKMAAFIRRLRY